MDVLAADIGASGGRIILGSLKKDRLGLKEIHRFPNGMHDLAGHLHWDIPAILAEIKNGILASKKHSKAIGSFGMDTWGVDYGLLTKDGDLLNLPFGYRDKRNQNAGKQYFKKMSWKTLYSLTGIQFLPFNTIFQLTAEMARKPRVIDKADKLLMIPELLTYFLTGAKAADRTNASTSQLLDAKTREWSAVILKTLGLKKSLLPAIVEPGTKVGKFSQRVSRDTGVQCPVIFPACHDTAAAVAATPAETKDDWCYISSGTWSLMGLELSKPILTDFSRENNFSHELGVNATYRYLKNIMGLWLIQECQRLWAKKGMKLTFPEICQEAEKQPMSESLIEPDHPLFLAPQDMTVAVAEYCRRSGQKVPSGVGPTARCVFESLALKYRLVYEQLNELMHGNVRTIHVFGGGSQNTLLCRMTAEASGCRVLAGPQEATALGNIGMQFIALGEIGSVAEMRQLIRKSFPIKEYLPKNRAAWDKSFAKFKDVSSKMASYTFKGC